MYSNRFQVLLLGQNLHHLTRAFKSAIALTDKTDGSNPTKRENYWMRTFKTFAPYGLNAVDGI